MKREQAGATAVIDEYRVRFSDEPDDVDFNSLFYDLLTDMRHAAVSNGIDFETALVISEGNFEEEAD
jgi:hypothetical protein